MTVAKETRFSFFRIVTYLHNKTNVWCTRMKISFFSYIYIFTYLHIYIFTYLHIYKTKTFSCTDTFTKQKASDVLIYLQNQKTLEEGVKRQIVCIRIGMCSVCTCNVHVHTHQGVCTCNVHVPRPQTLELWGSSPIAQDSRQKISRFFTLQKPNFEPVKRQMTVAKETRFVFFVCLYTKSKFDMHIYKTNGRWLSQKKQGLVFFV